MIRTIKGAVEELKKEDPESPVTVTTLRRWVLTGQLKHCKSGSRYLIDMDVLKAFMRGESE